MSTALSVRGLSAGYGPLQVLDGIDLDVAERERVGLVGLNGHGKSTLMRAVVGLVDWRTGEIDSDGRDLMKTPTHRLAREGIVLIPQGDSLFPGLSVRDNLDAGAFAPANWRKRAESRERVVEHLPAPRRAHEAGRRHALGRRAAHVLDRARPHGRGPHLPRRRAVARALRRESPRRSCARSASLDLGGGALVLAEQNRTLLEGRIDRIVRIHAGKVAGIEPGTPVGETT